MSQRADDDARKKIMHRQPFSPLQSRNASQRADDAKEKISCLRQKGARECVSAGAQCPFPLPLQAVASKYFVFMVTLVLVNLISEMVGFIGGIVTKASEISPSPPFLLCTPHAWLLLACIMPVSLARCSMRA